MVANDYDPMATGHVASLARPRGRITEVSSCNRSRPRSVSPNANRIAVFSDINAAGQLKAVQVGAKRLGVELQVLAFKRAPYDYESAFAEAVRAKTDALLPLASGRFAPAPRQIAELALKHRLPSMFGNYLWAEAGGLLSYGPNFSDIFRCAAEQASMILKGAKPAEMPVNQSTTFELVINRASRES